MGPKEIFTKNIGWKIGGLVLALALWFHLATEKTYEKEFSVDIEVVGLPDNLRIEKFEPKTAAIIVTGTGKQLLKLSFSEKNKLLADLSDSKSPGVMEYKFMVEDLYPIDPSKYQNIDISGSGIFDIHITEKN